MSDPTWREHAEELLGRYRAAGYEGRIPENPTYACTNCGENSTWVGVPLTPEMLTVCPQCGETDDDGILEGPILVIGEPIVLSES